MSDPCESCCNSLKNDLRDLRDIVVLIAGPDGRNGKLSAMQKHLNEIDARTQAIERGLIKASAFVATAAVLASAGMQILLRLI